MTYKEKRKLLHWLFDGHDEYGARYGIYITKKGKGRNAMIDYFMYGRLTGLRTLKGDDYDYLDHIDKELEEEESESNTDPGDLGNWQILNGKASQFKKKKHYKKRSYKTKRTRF